MYRQETWDESIRAFERLLAEFPEAQAAAEATYHIGLCHERAGRVRDAMAAFKATIRRFPETMWASMAAEHERNLR